jgi:hypothetical protein
MPPVPDWLPDWRDDSAYPDPSTTTSRQWAWGFLRRNIKYQNDCGEVGEAYFDSLRKNFFQTAKTDERKYGELLRDKEAKKTLVKYKGYVDPKSYYVWWQ